MTTLNISPDPNILIVLGNTPLKPIDALCELIDNALDSFLAARRAGLHIETRWVRISLPTGNQIENGEGVIRIIDNGIGLDQEGLRGALQAGFSNKNKYDQLGLFGVGFNIATAKLGQRTVVTTAKVDATGNLLTEKALRATMDLQEMRRRKSFDVPLEMVPRPVRGTVVEVSGWWPRGTPNDRFALELSKISKPKLIEQLGRRYSTVLLDQNFRVNMTVNEQSVIPFVHCVWSENRSISKRGVGAIPAKISFDEVLRTARRCEKDGNMIAEGENLCSACGGDKIKQIQERVRGWIGVQRFDDKSYFGVDIIRNGRAIRVAEKDAFFTYTNNIGETENEYPIDQLTGRIVGEVHLDHVPVDYTKQDFERPSREWIEAMEYLRGGGLQAKNRPTEEKNQSPIGRIFDGYRYTKKFGKENMYMGTWSESGPERISREVEADYYQRFKKGEPGYLDDAKWWELVESASIPPVRPLIHCSSCLAENPEGTEECAGCGEILIGKNCIGCKIRIRHNANSCPTCGANQRIEVKGPWRCETCDYVNSTEDEICGGCGLGKDAPNPMSPEALRAASMKIDDLSFGPINFRLVDGKTSQPLSVTTYHVPKDRLKPLHNQPSLPTYVPSLASLDKIDIYIDRGHPFFTELGFTQEFAVSAQIAEFLQSILGNKTHGRSTVNHTHRVLQTAFGEKVSITKESVRIQSEELFEEVVDRVIECDWSRGLSTDMTYDEREELVKRLQEIGKLSQLETLQQKGSFLRYVPRALARIYKDEHEKWNGSVFTDEFSELADFAPAMAAKSKERNRNQILRALEECAEFLDSPTSDEIVLRRVKSSVNYLKARVA